MQCITTLGSKAQDSGKDYLLLLATGRKRNRLIHPPINETDCKPHQHHNAHHSFQGDGPTIYSRTQILSQIREVLHCSAWENKGNIGSKSKQRVESFSFLNGSYLQEKQTITINGSSTTTIQMEIRYWENWDRSLQKI